MGNALVQSATIQLKAQAGGGFGSVPSVQPGTYITVTGDVQQGGVVSLAPVTGGFGAFGGLVRQYLKGDEGVDGSPIQGASAAGSQSTVTTNIIGLGADTTGKHLSFSTLNTRPGRSSSLRRTRNDKDDATQRNGGFGYSTGAVSDSEQFITYWRDVNSDSYSTSDPALNYKEFFGFGNGTRSDGGTETPQPILVAGAGDSSLKAGNNISPAGNISNTEGWSIPSIITGWSRRDVYYKLNTPGLADGVFKVWFDGVLGISNEAYEMQPDNMQIDATGFKGFRLGYFDQLMLNCISDYSDYYVANSQARVELGNAATWSACTHKEFQFVLDTDFTNLLISDVTLDKGGLTDIIGSYLYVIKADGTPYSENGEILV